MKSSSPDIAELLLQRYDDNARSLPWRVRPGDPSQSHDPAWPYRVWLSEVMLQQTTTAAVMPYFAEFTRRWPDVQSLAAARDEDVMAAWAGLGYYARALNLLACSRAVAARGGRFPETEEELRKLPGLGVYTAAAITAIAYGKRAVVVDANIERVVSRLFAIGEALPAARKAIRAAADTITPQARAGDFAQGMMDLGSAICTSLNPRCSLCPLSDYCCARGEEQPERYPVKAPKRAKPTRQGTAFWIAQGGEVFLICRPSKGMLGGMRALPDDGWSARGDGAAAPPVEGEWERAGVVRHTFTHFTLEMQLSVYLGEDCSTLLATAGEWWPLDRIEPDKGRIK